MEHNTEVLIITIDSELNEQIEQIIQPMGTSLEQLIIRFLIWCVSEPEQAIAYLKKAQENQKKELYQTAQNTPDTESHPACS